MIEFGRRGAIAAAVLAALMAPMPTLAARPPAVPAKAPAAPATTSLTGAVPVSPTPASPALASPAPASPAPAAAVPAASVRAKAQAGPAPIPTSPFSQVFAALAARLSGVVVNISTTEAVPQAPRIAQTAPEPNPESSLDEFFRDFLGEKGDLGTTAPHVSSLGSGFIIDPSGLIVTNNHVIANAAQITVTLSDDTVLQARVVGRDAVTDLALLKVDAKQPLPSVVWGDSTRTRVGDWVVAIGNPFGLGGTVTAGIISATARDIHSGPFDFLQTDASINRGNSGGPMFNLEGQVIGINTAIFSPSGGSIGIGFAIPAALARPIVEQLKTTGKVERGWIGAHIQPVTPDIAESLGLTKSAGALIDSIEPASPAQAAKLQPGDVILSYDGTPIARSRQLPRLVAETPPDKTVKLALWREGKTSRVTVKVAAFNPNRPPPPPPAVAKPKPPATVDVLGLKLARLTPGLRKHFALPDTATGVLVAEVPQAGEAVSQGLRAGDLVVAIGHTKVTTPKEVQDLAAAALKAGRKNVLVQIERDGSTRFVALPG